MTKICPKCKIQKYLNEYYNDKKTNDSKTSWCKNCCKIHTKNYRKTNKERVKNSNQQYYKNNIEKLKIKNKNYYLNNKEKIYKINKNWKLNNPEKVKIICKRWANKNKEYYYIKCIERRSLKNNLTGAFTQQEWNNIKQQYDNKCVLCKKDKKLTVDHIIPISKWNRWIKKHPEINYECNDIENIQPLCQSCNSSKGAKILT